MDRATLSCYSPRSFWIDAYPPRVSCQEQLAVLAKLPLERRQLLGLAMNSFGAVLVWKQCKLVFAVLLVRRLSTAGDLSGTACYPCQGTSGEESIFGIGDEWFRRAGFEAKFANLRSPYKMNYCLYV